MASIDYTHANSTDQDWVKATKPFHSVHVHILNFPIKKINGFVRTERWTSPF
jgi:hypothetical protein